MSFEQAFEQLVNIEGGYVDDPADRGGKTKYGITEAVARAHGYTGAMRDMPLEVAAAIYRARYWDSLQLDAVEDWCQPLAWELFDTGVNTGVGVAGTFLQRALNALNREQKDYPDVTVDGLVGPMTLQALRRFLAKRGPEGEDVLLAALNALQGARYIAIAEADRSQERFVYGWLAHRVAL